MSNFKKLVHLCGHVGSSVSLSDASDQAGDVDDVSLVLAKVRQRKLQTRRGNAAVRRPLQAGCSTAAGS